MKKDLILNYLSQGLKPSQVASIVGVTPAYISQLLKQEDFATTLQAKSADAEKEYSEDKTLTNKYLALEHTVLNNIENAMLGADLRDLTATLRVISERQDRRAIRALPQIGAGQPTQVVVNLMLPQHAVPEYLVNPQREVIAIEGKPLAPMSSDGVKNLFAQIQGQRAAQAIENARVPEDF